MSVQQLPLTLCSYIWYPETRKRSLEEIDIIFAKGYCENMSYVKAAKELPLLSSEEVEQMALQYGGGELRRRTTTNAGDKSDSSSAEEKAAPV